MICTRITFLTTIFPPPAAAPLHTSLKIITSETAGQNKFRNFTGSKSDMTPKNILLITNRKDFRQWLSKNHMAEKESGAGAYEADRCRIRQTCGRCA